MSNARWLKKGQYIGNVTSLRCGNGVIASAATAYNWEEQMAAPHYHENPIICTALEGHSIERINRRVHDRLAGDTKFCGGGELHQVLIKTFRSKTVAFEFESSFLMENDISESDLHATAENNPDVRHKILRMYKELLRGDIYTDSSIRMMLLSLVKDTEKSNNQKRPKWTTDLFELLNDRWNEQIALHDLSAAIHVHPVTISKYFTRYFSCTFGEYMRKLKINKSISLIKNSHLSLTEIALLCGFADQSHFTRNFKELTGFLPKDFKKL
jgi:AraC family transcriptional regulator